MASIKGSILSINQQATVVDIIHTIETYATGKAAYIISTVYKGSASRLLGSGVGGQIKIIPGQ